MSLWGDIGNFLSSAVGDVEHVFGGNSAPATQTPRPQQAQPQGQPQAFQVRPPQAVGFQGPSPAQIQAQQAQQDEQAAAAQQAFNQNQGQKKRPGFLQDVENFGKGTVQQFVNPVAKLGNEVAVLPDLFTGNKQAAQNRLQSGGGFLHQGGVLGGRELQPGAVFIGPGAVKNIEKTAGVGAQIGSNIAAAGAGLGEGALGSRIAKGALQGAGINTVGGAGQQLANNGKLNAKGLAENAALGAVLGGGIPVAKAGFEDRTPLNEVGAIGKNVGKNVGKNLNEGAFSKEDQKYLQSLNNQEKAELPQKQQMALAKMEGKAPGELAPPEVNTARNPFKANIPEVKAGDYAQARINPQIASSHVEFAGGQWVKAMRNLQRTNPDEFANFWRAVEKPNGKYSPQLKEAIARWRDVDNRIHGTSQQLGGNTNYLTNHALHPWNLPPEFTDHIINGGDPDKFPGISSLSRKHLTIAEGEKAGLVLGNDPIKEGINYIGASSTLLKRRALIKGFAEADRNEAKTHSVPIGGSHDLKLSEKGAKEALGYRRVEPRGKVMGAYEKGLVRPSKQVLLSASEFHPINITAKAAPAMALRGHPIRALQGAYGAFRSQVGRGYSDALQQQALKDGTVDFGSRVGSPLKFGSDYATEGKLNLGKAGFGERTIFEKSMPALHYRMLQSLKADLDKRGLAYNSPEAHAAGTRVNEIMGFVNTEVRNLSGARQRAFSDVALAPQFTRAKWATIKSALKDTRLNNASLAGSYARRAVIGNTAAEFAVILAAGYLAKQKSDDVKDMLIRAIFNPAVPTNQKDSKGNTLEYALPKSYTSEALGLITTVYRGPDGHLHVKFSNPGQLGGNLKNYGQARLNIPVSTALKLATNQNYAGRPMYDPNAPFGTKAQQFGVTAAGGLAPIGLQGLLQTQAVEKHLPQNIQQVINAQKPGSNPLVKSIGSAFGATAKTDTTVGKGLQTTQYFGALDAAKKGLNRQESDALDLYSGSKKNPITGQYDIRPTVFDQSTKASTLLQNPRVIDHLISMNQTLQQQGQKVDPLWLQPKNRIISYLHYETMPPGGPDQADWRNKNPWYNKGMDSLYTQRNQFYSSLPPGDPNKPKAPIEYPQPTAQTTNDMNKWTGLLKTNPSQAEQFLLAHANIQTQLDNQAAYTNAVRVARGYGALRTYPTPPPSVEVALNSMPKGSDRASKKARALIYNRPDVAQWMQQDAIYNLTKNAAVAQIQGESLNNKALKAIGNLNYDLVKNPDGTYALKYKDIQGGTGGTAVQPGVAAVSGSKSSGSNSGKYKYYKMDLRTPNNLRLKTKKARYIKYRLATNYNKIGKIKAKVPQQGYGKSARIKGLPIQTF